MTWYQKLIRCIEVGGTGTVAEFLRSTVDSGLFSLAPKSNSLDASIAIDVSDWFHTRFKPWFMKISLPVGEGSGEELSSAEFIEKVNTVLTSLNVARAYYAKKADDEFVTSLKMVARFQAQFCEELAEALQDAYKGALAVEGLSPVYGMQITEASTFSGTTPEKFVWPGTIEAYHQIIKTVEAEGQQQQEAQQQYRTPQYLPWVFTAVFGLIAWSAAAKKQ